MITLIINGTARQIDDDPETPLLYVLRGTLALNAAKYGCGLAQCGSCTVLIRDRATPSCIVPVGSLDGQHITTLEGLGSAEHPGPLQRAFLDEQAAQCGFCTAGMIMRAQALLLENSNPSDEVIRRHMEPNLCRCGTYLRILRAVKRASNAMRATPSATPLKTQ